MKATVNGLDTYYEIHGEENDAKRQGKPWLVFSHSLACSTRMWDGQVAAFKDRYRVLAYDTRGHGPTAAPRGQYTLEGLADDLHALLEHLKIQKPHFIGLSMGGMIGQTFALKYPGVLASLTLADTTSRYPAEAAATWQDRIRVAETKGMEPLVQATLERWFTEPFRKSRPDVVGTIANLIQSTPVPGYVGCCQAIAKLNTTARLKEIEHPVLAIAGEQDAAAPGTRYIGENVPGAKTVMIPQAAHIANLEQPEAFNRALREFLSSPASGRA